jgi:hypothetical protein
MIRKNWVKQNQRDARNIMNIDSQIWREKGWEDGGMVRQDVLKAELRLRLKKKKFSPIVAEILEDANFHSSNQALQELGFVKYPKKSRLKSYLKGGGKTWNIPD